MGRGEALAGSEDGPAVARPSTALADALAAKPAHRAGACSNRHLKSTLSAGKVWQDRAPAVCLRRSRPQRRDAAPLSGVSREDTVTARMTAWPLPGQTRPAATGPAIPLWPELPPAHGDPAS